MAVTLKDIAERTGVSPSVVSTVLSGRDNGTFVSDNTRRKVLQVAELLNYTPVRSGRPRGSRRLRRLHTEHFIGVWDADYSPHTAYAVQNLQMALHQHSQQAGAEASDDFGLRLLTVDDLPRLDALGIMGIIIVSPTLLPREAASATIPCVMIGEVDNPPRELVQVHLDNVAGGRSLGEYLWILGHRRVAFLGRDIAARISRLRSQGLQEAWSARAADPEKIVVLDCVSGNATDERELIRNAVQKLVGEEATAQTRPTAIVCHDENIAAIVVQTLSEIGLRIPANISVTAFGDTPRLAESLTPPLTTFRLPILQMAQAAITALYGLHDAEDPEAVMPRDIALPGQLIVRASCSSPARA